MKRLSYSLLPCTCCLLLVLGFHPLGCSSGSNDATPNVILIIGDDHGYRDFGFLGSKHAKTPHLDELANSGTTFTHGFVTGSTCRPSLLSLQTGLHPYQWNLRLEALESQGIDVDSVSPIDHFNTLPAQLERASFLTFQVGKYWEGHYRHGGFTHGTQEFELTKDTTDKMQRAGGNGLSLGRESIDIATDFLDEHQTAPFFMWFAPMLPHIPHNAPEAYVDLYEGRGYRPSDVQYLANVTRFDAAVGKLLRYLDESGLREKTLLIYLSDNGWEQNYSRETARLGGLHGKATAHEPGFRTPIVFNWPGHVPAGRTNNELVSSVDLVPTILDYAKVQQIPNLPGESLYPLLSGTGEFEREAVVGSVDLIKKEPPKVKGLLNRIFRDPQFLETRDIYFIRTRVWRYIWYKDRDEHSLYRIEDDPEETTDLASQNPDVVVQLRREIQQWQASMKEMVEATKSPPANLNPPRAAENTSKR